MEPRRTGSGPGRFAIRAVGRTDVGRSGRRTRTRCTTTTSSALYLVCDGMGGHASGQVASDIAIRTIVHSLKTGDPLPAPGQDPLVAAMKAANAAVLPARASRSRVPRHGHHRGRRCGSRRPSSTSATAATRARYLLRHGQLHQLTRDHSLRNLYQDRPDLIGTLGPATSNVIIRAVGLDASVEIEHSTMPLEHGDVYLLCCDGLSDLVDDWMIREIMTSGESLEVDRART